VEDSTIRCRIAGSGARGRPPASIGSPASAANAGRLPRDSVVERCRAGEQRVRQVPKSVIGRSESESAAYSFSLL
jgi:hypothetical protein